MTSTAISVSETAAAVTAAADNVRYGRFREVLAGSFVEPVRPSVADVAAVAAALRSVLTPTLSQDVIGFTETAVLGPAFGDLDGGHRYRTEEGKTHRLRISPGIIRSRSFDAAKLAATVERSVLSARRSADMHADVLADGGDVAAVGSKAEITAFSAKSRVNLTETVASLDFSNWPVSDGDLAMVTVTLPGDWEPVAPDGATFKKFVKKLRERWEYHTGLPWRLIWKLEFQRRGAPHWHALMRVPVFVKGRTFEHWLSHTWADIVGASDVVDGKNSRGEDTSEYLRHVAAGTGVDFSGKDFTDPRRIGMYFLGHSSKTMDNKEYQHVVPELWQAPGKGPGRFWGYVGLVKAVIELDLTPAERAVLDRQLRKVKKARDWTVAVKRAQGAAIRKGFTAAAVDVFGVGDAVKIPRKRGARLGRAAQTTRNRRARLAAHASVLCPFPGHEVLAVHGPLTATAWQWQKRSFYAPFSGGQGGMVLVNDALRLAQDLGRFLELRRTVRGSWDGHVPPSVVGEVKDWGDNPYSTLPYLFSRGYCG